ncbi:MAG: 3-isopropylmalate dehydratase [Anaerolineaceae bacterium]|nr:3-isopropylmalate dehydratase [Anaerolineaceae bacterium]
MKVIRGRVWKFGDNVNTDLMSPGFAYSMPWEQYKRMILHTHPVFTQQAKPGDIIVAGNNWGCGSSREKAITNLKKLGISCDIAESFARIYFRNGIAFGLPNIICPGVSRAFQEGDELELELESGRVRNLTEGIELKGEQLPELLLTILNSGGIISFLAQGLGSTPDPDTGS